MKDVVALALVVCTVVAAEATSASTSSRRAVPVSVERAIEQGVGPDYAYAPTHLPAGWHYLRWDPGTSTNRPPTGIRLNIWFATSLGLPDMGFHVAPSRLDRQSCERRGSWGTDRVNGVKVSWALSDFTEAWRCVKPGGKVVQLLVTASGPGGWGRPPSATSLVRRHVRALARMLASVRRLRQA